MDIIVGLIFWKAVEDMLEFEEYKVKLNNIKPTLDGLGTALKLDDAKAEIAELEAESAKDGFWNDIDRSQKVQKRLKQLQQKCEKYEKLRSTWDDLMVICEMALEENDDSMLGELEADYAKLESELEAMRLSTLLSGRYENICVVGDDDQSIYKFRGANIGNILGFEHVFPDARVIRLEQNYRSTRNILNAANQVIANNTERKAKTLWTENEEGSKVHFRQFLNAYEEAEYVVGEISRAHRENGAKYKDCAVLYRTNAQSRLFEEKCLLANIPYKIVGGVNFYARKEIKDLLCYLKIN